MPLLFADWPDAPPDLILALSKQLDLAATAAKTGSSPVVDRFEVLSETFAYRDALHEHHVADLITFVVERTLSASEVEPERVTGFIMDELTTIQNAAEAAYEDLESYVSLQRNISADLTRILELAATEHWTDETPVRVDVFGPLTDVAESPSQAVNDQALQSLQQQFVVESCKLGIALIQGGQQLAVTDPAKQEGSRLRRAIKPLGQLLSWLVKLAS